MSDPYVGEIRMFAGNYAPQSWAICNGQTLPINSNEALYSLIGPTYGGDSQTDFALPDMRGRLPVHQGTGTGLTARTVGQKFGSETVTLTAAEMPAHNHSFMATTNPAIASDPTGAVLAAQSDADTPYTSQLGDSTKFQTMNSASVGFMGGGLPHDNMMPYLAINFIICVSGIYPTRN